MAGSRKILTSLSHFLEVLEALDLAVFWDGNWNLAVQTPDEASWAGWGILAFERTVCSSSCSWPWVPPIKDKGMTISLEQQGMSTARTVIAKIPATAASQFSTPNATR